MEAKVEIALSGLGFRFGGVSSKMIYWLAVQELNSSYYARGTILVVVYTRSAYLI